jgi:hexosaminidase
MILRRLAGGPRVKPLKVLAEAVEPLKNYQRHSQAAYTSLSPFGRFVDACAPESMPAWRFSRTVDRYLDSKDGQTAEELRLTLTAWRDNHAAVLELVAGSPALAEIEPLSFNLARSAKIGLEALGYLAKGQGQPAAWAEEQRKILAEAGRPAAHAELVVVKAVSRLVDACAGAAK